MLVCEATLVLARSYFGFVKAKQQQQQKSRLLHSFMILLWKQLKFLHVRIVEGKTVPPPPSAAHLLLCICYTLRSLQYTVTLLDGKEPVKNLTKKEKTSSCDLLQNNWWGQVTRLLRSKLSPDLEMPGFTFIPHLLELPRTRLSEQIFLPPLSLSIWTPFRIFIYSMFLIHNPAQKDCYSIKYHHITPDKKIKHVFMLVCTQPHTELYPSDGCMCHLTTMLGRRMY